MIMTTVSVPLNEEMHRLLTWLIDNGIASNKADAFRKALKKYAEDEAVEAVLRASKEPRLSGNLQELADQIL
jgi:Arc/MetJ-type ribon-helix-helix transcriptional regulator